MLNNEPPKAEQNRTSYNNKRIVEHLSSNVHEVPAINPLATGSAVHPGDFQSKRAIGDNCSTKPTGHLLCPGITIANRISTSTNCGYP